MCCSDVGVITAVVCSLGKVKMPGRIFIVVLAISLAVGEEGAAPSPLDSNGPKEDTEPIKQAQMEGLHEVLQEPWTPLEKSYSTSEETSDQKQLLDSLSLSPSLVIRTQEDTLSSGFPELASLEDTVNAMEAESQLGDIVIDTIAPTNLAGAGPAKVLQQELPGLTKDNLLHMIGPEFQDNWDWMSYEEIMDALAEKVAELEEEAEAQLSPEERAAWDRAKEGEVRETEIEEDREEELEGEIPGEVIVWYEVEKGEADDKEMPEKELEENKGNQDWDSWSIDLIPTYSSDYEKERAAERLKEWEKWTETLRLLEEAEQEEEDVWSCRLRLIPTFFACLLIVATLIIVTHQCFIEKRWKRRASLDEQAPVLLPKEPLVPPVLVIVPQQKGKQLLY